MARVARKLTPRQRKLMRVLARLNCATLEQLAYWLETPHISSVSRPIKDLQASLLVVLGEGYHPGVYRLSRAGCALLGLTYRDKWLAPMAVQRTVLVNQAEITLRQHMPELTFIDRPTLYRMGLNPARGEYGAVTDKDRKNVVFVFVDDALLPSQRLLEKWTREHTARSEYFKESLLMRWSDVASQYWVICTDEVQVSVHQQAFASAPIDITFLHVAALQGEGIAA